MLALLARTYETTMTLVSAHGDPGGGLSTNVALLSANSFSSSLLVLVQVFEIHVLSLLPTSFRDHSRAITSHWNADLISVTGIAAMKTGV